MTAVVAPPLPEHAGRRARPAAPSPLLAVAALLVLALGVSAVLGFRILIVRSDSMAPAVRAGDVVITGVTRPGEVGVGDIVTFRDPSRSQALVTHRVVEAQRQGGRYAFVTKGDANTGKEQWSIDAGGSVGVLAFRIPRIGYGLAQATAPTVRATLLILSAVLLSVAAVRRIWGVPAKGG